METYRLVKARLGMQVWEILIPILVLASITDILGTTDHNTTIYRLGRKNWTGVVQDAGFLICPNL